MPPVSAVTYDLVAMGAIRRPLDLRVEVGLFYKKVICAWILARRVHMDATCDFFIILSSELPDGKSIGPYPCLSFHVSITRRTTYAC